MTAEVTAGCNSSLTRTVRLHKRDETDRQDYVTTIFSCVYETCRPVECKERIE